MGKFLGFLCALFFTFAFTGCTKSGLCDAGKTAGSLLSAQVALQFECSGLEAIKSDIEAKLVDLKVCEAPAPAPSPTVGIQGAVGSVVCKPVIDGLAAGLLAQVPPKWGCKGGPLTDEIKMKLLEACSKAL